MNFEVISDRLKFNVEINEIFIYINQHNKYLLIDFYVYIIDNNIVWSENINSFDYVKISARKIIEGYWKNRAFL